MISFFRRIFSSKIGLFLTLGFVGLIAIAFATSDVSSNGAFGGVTGSGTVAKIGDTELTTAELNESVTNAFRGEQRENPTLDLKSYIQGGGFDAILDRLINSFSISAFGSKFNMVAGKRLIDGEIAKVQAFQGADGQFSEENYRAALQRQGISEKQLRDDIARNLVAEQLLNISGFGAFVPEKLVLPYAALLLESRQGQVAIIPSASFVDNKPPAPAAITAFYKANETRYTIPERRTISYSLFDISRFSDKIKPAEKDIVNAYNMNKARYAASETRDITQVIVPTEAAAKALAAKINGGTPITAAAQSVDLSASKLSAISKESYIRSASEAVASAAFAAKPGTIAGPAKSALGWHIVQVTNVQQTAGKTLEQVRPEIVAALTGSKIEEAMANFTASLEEEFADGSTLADVAGAEGLKIEATPSLVADGQNPDDQNYRPIPEMKAILPVAFTMEEGSDPQVVEIVPGKQYAAISVTAIKAAAPPPLKMIEQLVSRDYALDQASKKAKIAADKISKAVSSGTDLAKAIADAGVQKSQIERVNNTRAQLAQLGQQGRVPPPLTLMFSMAQGTAKTLKAPQNQGWYIVALEKIVTGDATKQPELLTATKAQFKQVFGNEYTDQFVRAMRADVGVKKNDNVISALKNQLMGSGN